MLRQYDEGVDFFATSDTFSEAYKLWLETVAPEIYGKKSVYNAKCYIEKHILPIFGNAKMDNIEARHIQKFFATLTVTKWQSDPKKPKHKLPVEAPASDATKKKIYAPLKSIFTYAKTWGFYTTENPCLNIILKTPKIQEHETWNDEEINYFLSLKDVQQSVYYLAFLILATTGMRREEVCGLQRKDYDGNGFNLVRAMDIYGEITDMKTESSHRRVCLMDFVIDAVDTHIHQQDIIRRTMYNPTLNDFIVTDELNKPINPKRLTNWFKKFIIRNNESHEKTGEGLTLPVIPLKNLRHSFATMAIQGDINIKIVSEMLGHSKTSTTQNFYQGKIKQTMQESAIFQLQNRFSNKYKNSDSKLG